MTHTSLQEQVARIVDPNAWSLFDHGETNPVWVDAKRQASLVNADQIIALMLPPAEQIARVIAASYGVEPDDFAPLAVMCTAENEPVAWWKVYEEQADAVLASFAGRAALEQGS